MIMPVRLVNLWCMCKGYGSHSVCVCLSVTVLPAICTYLIYKSQVRYYKVPFGNYGVSNVYTVWISLKTMCLQTLGFHAL